MTDGMSAGTRDQRASNDLDDAIEKLVDLLKDEYHDPMFGMPRDITARIRRALEPLGLRVEEIRS